ncbi:hypothetical protein V5O48_005452 [Marasmius crinis-equi]|uniref:Uncharacterized protein n=1 Tax=Marasmius crinis-equi TaxID=585013 RepID=A0ABR3FM87_9AGAR
MPSFKSLRKVLLWDAGFCFMRPRSFEGGDLHWLWGPYGLYQKVDLVYSVEAYERGDGFTNAQALLNIVENFLNMLYLYTAYVSAWPPAPLIGFTAASMTLAKTVLYWVQEYYCNFCAIGHNDLKTLIQYWILPGGLGKDLVGQLNLADKAEKAAKVQKAA